LFDLQALLFHTVLAGVQVVTVFSQLAEGGFGGLLCCVQTLIFIDQALDLFQTTGNLVELGIGTLKAIEQAGLVHVAIIDGLSLLGKRFSWLWSIAGEIDLLYTYFIHMVIQRKLILTCVLLLLAISVPYALAAQLVGPEHVFGGFFLGPLDGNTYLAKMQLGAAGEWKFHLSYSPYGGDGAYIFLFYIFLGWLAHSLGVPLIGMFHLARLLAVAGMLAALWSFARWVTRGDLQLAYRVFLFGAIGSGLGWAASLFVGYISIDLWLVDAYPFLSAFVTPHFALGLALVLWICLLIFEGRMRRRWWLLPLLGLLLATVQPFDVVTLAIPVAGYFLLHRDRILSADLPATLAAFVPAGAYLLYQFGAIHADPLLSQWNEQNITLSPPFWDILIGFSPALLLAGVGSYRCWKVRDSRCGLMLFWLAAGLVLVYLPFPVQRRFMSGLFIPTAVLAVFGLESLANQPRRLRWLWPATLIVSILTNLLLVSGGVIAASGSEPLLTMTKAEAQGVAWVGGHTPRHALVLASPHLGMYLPAYGDCNVLYGHPFESIGADAARQSVEDFFSGRLSAQTALQYLLDHEIGYVMVEPGDQLSSGLAISPVLRLVYEQDHVQVYEVTR